MSASPKPKRILIVTPKWDEKNGGIIVLHKICDLFNQLGREALLVPYIDTYVIEPGKTWKGLKGMLRSRLYRWYRTFATNPAFNTPVLKGRLWEQNLSDSIVIYPEQVAGNPLRAPHVVRWLLHKPGFHSKHIMFGQGELYFPYSHAFGHFELSGSTTSALEWRIIHYPLEHYNLTGALPEDQRQGVAYCLRKGRDKPQIHHPADAICIDALPHAEVAAVFKRVKRFVSYDTNTAYSFFAALCGCESVVVPNEGMSMPQWQPNEADAYGVAYGFDDDQLTRARNTRHLVIHRIREMDERNMTLTRQALAEMDTFFNQVPA